jgi:hypothetical protein
MSRVIEILRSLFTRTLSEHGREAPALTDIIIDRGSRRFRPRLTALFSNGYRAWSALRPADCYEFCARHSAWDVDSLRRLLLREAHQIYAQMFEAHVIEPRLRERRAMHLRRLGDELARSLRPHWSDPLFDGFGRGGFGEIGSKEAQERGLRLLEENLTSAQREQLAKYRYFDVIGGRTGRRYRIRYGRQMNIDQIDRNGGRICGWCFVPQGRLVAGDVMLAQKVALELFEPEALKVARRF